MPIVPHLDPMPVPGPLWLLRTLLLLTFFLHLLFMNTLLGGSVVAFVARVRSTRSDYAAQLARDLGRMLPTVFAFTITLGIAPLLFVQVIYGHLLYATADLLAVAWLGIIGLVLLAYYGVYYFAFRAANRASVAVLGVAILLLALIASIYTNAFTLMLTPGRWLALYTHNPSGWNLNWADATVLPRYLHVVLGALAISGLFLLVLGLRKRETPYGRWVIQQGASLFLSTTILNFLVGFWFLTRIPADIRMLFMGQNAFGTALLGIGILFALAAMAHAMMLRTGKAPVRQAAVAIGAGVLTVAVMVLMRDVLRNGYLAPYFRPEQLQVAPQWSVIVLFVLMFVGGLAILAYMLRAVAKGKSAAARAGAGQ